MGFFDFLRFSKKNPKRQAKRIFISFAIEDRKYRDYLVEQAKKNHSPFSFIDMSVKKRWQEHEWQDKCRKKIGRCHAVIVLLSSNTYHASGARFEMRCANELGKELAGLHIFKNSKSAIPPELQGKDVMEWNWPNLEKFVNGLA